jgi:O-acetyl-ADP-ribose deacetylase (regulator of RNase III)
MVITQARGDLFAAGLPALAHGCNCAGTMGAGVAREFRRRWPDMYRLYRDHCRSGTFLPGDVLAWTGSPVVYNLAVQMRPGSTASVAAIQVAVARMLQRAEDDGVGTIGMPRVGCGSRGLRWAEVGPVLEDLAAGSPVDLIVFAPA